MKPHINTFPDRIFKGVLTLMTLMALSSCQDGNLRQSRCMMNRIAEFSSDIDTILSVNTIPAQKEIVLTETSFLCQQQLNHMYILKVNLDGKVALRPSSPDNLPVSGEKQDMLGQVAAAEQAGSEVYYAINADVFGGYRDDLQGLPVPMGVLVIDGKSYQSFHHRTAENVFYVREDGSVNIDKYENFNKEKDIRQALGAWHTLVWDGQPASVPEDILGQGYHPRTFLGITKDRRTLFIFVVDGRQPGYSNGLQMKNMIDICLAVGCDRAVNLDGGGSTTLVGKQGNELMVLNRPSDEGNVPRQVVDGLLLVKRAK